MFTVHTQANRARFAFVCGNWRFVVFFVCFCNSLYFGVGLVAVQNEALHERAVGVNDDVKSFVIYG